MLNLSSAVGCTHVCLFGASKYLSFFLVNAISRGSSFTIAGVSISYFSQQHQHCEKRVLAHHQCSIILSLGETKRLTLARNNPLFHLLIRRIRIVIIIVMCFVLSSHSREEGDKNRL